MSAAHKYYILMIISSLIEGVYERGMGLLLKNISLECNLYLSHVGLSAFTVARIIYSAPGDDWMEECGSNALLGMLI